MMMMMATMVMPIEIGCNRLNASRKQSTTVYTGSDPPPGLVSSPHATVLLLRIINLDRNDDNISKCF